MLNKIFSYIFILYFSVSALFAGIPIDSDYLSPTKQLIKRESWEKIHKHLKEMHIPDSLIPFFQKISDTEEWGHIGYHGANQGFRIYQDIIRFTLEEIVRIPIRDNFHFFRVPGDSDLNLNTIQDFLSYWGKDVNNRTRERAKQIVSLNYAIYSNYKTKGSSSVNLFVKDKSRTKVDYAKMLVPFYEELGIPSNSLKELFETAHRFLDEEGGILIKLEEISHLTHPKQLAYDFLDQQGYPCKAGGYKYGNYPVSNHFERIMTPSYTAKTLDISPQLRLLMNSKHTLNPNSYLNMYRWDLYDKETIKNYESSLRKLIRKLKYDSSKVKAYRTKLNKLWE